MLCHNRSSDYDYNYTIHIYTQNGSISQLPYGNNSTKLILQYEINYFMNVTTECCGSTVNLANFNFQFINRMNQYSHPSEIYNNISVTLYYDCNRGAYNYVYIREILTSKSV